ncbi:primase-helicase family protein [Methanococcus maripaludis]|uniref:NrS-1 polymerase-like helicase domain-containing protein n=1 Tax=Methanococcus maripaludis TaxID=39152 RepID=A0A2L1C8E4_METMI|nr:primase-helicase family protein [Methanococcus maripaludis]AVB75641.1 hypothetical protein MMJJ_02220 [Methanococcus maripaludis]
MINVQSETSKMENKNSNIFTYTNINNLRLNFLKKLFQKQFEEIDGEKYFEIRLLNQNGKPKFFKVENLEDFENIDFEEFKKENESYNIYFSQNLRKKESGKAENTYDCYSYVVLDFDFNLKEKNNNKALEFCKNKYKSIKKELGMVPSFSVFTGHGLHLYFTLEKNTNFENIKKIKNIVENLKNPNLKGIDSKVYSPSQILRLPYFNNIKNPKEVKKSIILEENDIEYDFEELKENLEKLTPKTSKKEFKTIETQEKEIKRDIFFETFLKNEELKKEIAEKDGIQKNDILFKNLAFYVKNFLDLEELAYEFVEECGHSTKEFEGWLRKDSKEVNYREIRNWVDYHHISELKNLIEKQLKDKCEFFDNYSIAYVYGRKNDFRYLVFDEKTKTGASHKKNQLVDFFKGESTKLGYKLVDLLNIPQINEENDKPYTKSQLNRMIFDKLEEKFEDENFLTNVYDEGYEPSDKRFFEYLGNKYINTYRAGKFENYFEPKEKYNFKYIEKLLRHITGDDDDCYKYFNKWLSYILKNPTDKLPTSLIFKGTQGIGKGRLREWILNNIFGEQNIDQIEEDMINNKWGDYVKNNRFVIVNEIKIDKNDKKSSKKIKTYSTDKDISIQQKNKPLEKIKNYSHWIFFSDQDNPMNLEKKDRRHTVFNQDDKIPYEIVEKLSPERNKGYLEQELKEYVSYLRTLNPTHMEVSNPMMTKAKKDLFKENEKEIFEAINYDIFNLCGKTIDSLANALKKREKNIIEYIVGKLNNNGLYLREKNYKIELWITKEGLGKLDNFTKLEQINERNSLSKIAKRQDYKYSTIRSKDDVIPFENPKKAMEIEIWDFQNS